MSHENTKVISISINIGKAPIDGIYLRKNIFEDLFGFIILGDVVLHFDSKEAAESLQNAVTKLKEKWLVEEQEGVPESA